MGFFRLMLLAARIERRAASMSKAPLGSVKLLPFTRGTVTKDFSSWDRGSKWAATKSGDIEIRSVSEEITNMDEEWKALETRKMLLSDYFRVIEGYRWDWNWGPWGSNVRTTSRNHYSLTTDCKGTLPWRRGHMVPDGAVRLVISIRTVANSENLLEWYHQENGIGHSNRLPTFPNLSRAGCACKRAENTAAEGYRSERWDDNGSNLTLSMTLHMIARFAYHHMPITGNQTTARHPMHNIDSTRFQVTPEQDDHSSRHWETWSWRDQHRFDHSSIAILMVSSARSPGSIWGESWQH